MDRKLLQPKRGQASESFMYLSKTHGKSRRHQGAMNEVDCLDALLNTKQKTNKQDLMNYSVIGKVQGKKGIKEKIDKALNCPTNRVCSLLLKSDYSDTGSHRKRKVDRFYWTRNLSNVLAIRSVFFFYALACIFDNKVK